MTHSKIEYTMNHLANISTFEALMGKETVVNNVYVHNSFQRCPVTNKKLPKDHRSGDADDGGKAWWAQLLNVVGLGQPASWAKRRVGEKGREAKLSDKFLRSLKGEAYTNKAIAESILPKITVIYEKGGKGIPLDSYEALQENFGAGKVTEDQFNQLLHDLYYQGEIYDPEDYDDPDFGGTQMYPHLDDFYRNPEDLTLYDVDEDELDPEETGALVSRKLKHDRKKYVT